MGYTPTYLLCKSQTMVVCIQPTYFTYPSPHGPKLLVTFAIFGHVWICSSQSRLKMLQFIHLREFSASGAVVA